MKHKLRQLLALILAMSMVLSLLSANVWAAETSEGEVEILRSESVDEQEDEPEEEPEEEPEAEPKEDTEGEESQEEEETQSEEEEAEAEEETTEEPAEAEPEPEEKGENSQETVEQPQTKNKAKKLGKSRMLTAQADGSSTSTLTFTAMCRGSGTADDNVTWTVTSDAAESNFENSKGIHYGTNNKPVQYIRLSTSGITGTITKVVVNASYGGTYSGGNTVGVTVGGTAFGGDPKTIDKNAADYTFTGSGSGEINVTVTKPASATGALYVKSIAVTYSTSPTVDVTDVTLNKTSATITVGGTETLTATVAPTDATDKTVKWSVSGTDADAVKLYTDADCTAEVGTDATGTLTVYAKGISAGSATVTATSNADSEKSASCDVTVNAAGDTTYTIIIPSTLTVANSGWNSIGNITADNAENTFDTSKKLTVTASSANSWNLKSSENNTVSYTMCNGTTSKGDAATSWTFTPAQLNESNAATQGIGIDVSDYSDKPAGTYTDTVTFTASVEDTAPATVPVTAITLNKTATTIQAGNNETLSVSSVTPDNATDKTVTWSSDKESVATVDADGKVTAVAAGTANITATANGGSGVTATCAVTVTIPVTSVTINNAPTEALFVNSTGTLTATVSPDNATDKTVTWSSSDPDYVSINETTGEYTIMGKKGYGSATITATAGDKTATCTITGKVTYTSLSAGTVLHVGDTFYAGKVYFNTTPATSFQDSNGVITLVEDNGCYKFKRGSNGTMPNVTAYKVKDNTDGIYIVSGSGTSTSDRFVLAVHTRPITFTVKRVAAGDGWNYEDGSYTVAAGTTWQQFIDSGDAPACLSITRGRVWHDMNASIMDCGGTLIANTADKKRVKPGDVIIDGATYGCSDSLNYQDHD